MRGAPGPLPRRLLRIAALLAWGALLAAFWLGTRQADAGPLEYALAGLEAVSRRAWAPAALLGLYLLRPLLLVPITVLNLAAGFLLGPLGGLGLGLAGVLLSATVGYALGRALGSSEEAERLAERRPFVRALRRRGFEAVLAGGLMYLHADAVNLPAGLLRIRFPVFLAGIALGNALALTAAVLAGASVEGRLTGLTGAEVRFDARYLAAAAVLLLVGLTLAYALRRRGRERA